MKRNTRVNLENGSFVEDATNGYYPAIMIDNKYCVVIIGASFFNFKDGIVWNVAEFAYNAIINKWLLCTGQFSNNGSMYVNDKNYVNATGITTIPPKTKVTKQVHNEETNEMETVESWEPDYTGLFPQFTFFKASPIGQGIFQMLLANLSVRIPEL